ncbi:MAG: MHYT domain-containing protein [Thermoanaerobaculia bacterium]
MVIHALHDHRLVALSILISIVAAYASRALAGRLRVARGRPWVAWFAGAAIVDGISTWSMHYTGMLALRLPAPQMFDWRKVILSFFVGVGGSALALLSLGRGRISWLRALTTGIFLGGIGISGLHYSAMRALRVRGLGHEYSSPALVTASVLLAILISAAAAPLAFAPPTQVLRNHAGAFLRGAANPAMHYTSMAALIFFPAREHLDFQHTVSIASVGILGISIVPLMVLLVALLTTLADRLATQRALLDELFEQAPQAVALMRGDGRVVRINREFTRMFGYSAGEALGRRLEDLILGPESREPPEITARRKDGSTFPASMIRVPVSVPGGQVEIYAILTDMTESKKAEEALTSYPRRLIETQEAEGQRIARELHDEIGQVLTGVHSMLGISAAVPPENARTILADAQSLLRDLVERVRNLALDLRPSMLDDFGVVAAVQWLVQRYAAQTGVRVDIVQSGLEETRFSAEVEIAAYRIIQEALTNVARHAQTREAIVRIRQEPRTLIVEVEDPGIGFDPSRLSRQTIGVQGMDERVSILGGRLTVESSPGAGTRITAELPLPS